MVSRSGPARVRGWYYGWNIVALAILSQVAVSGMIIYSYALFLPVWASELHAPISALQLQMLGMTSVCAFTDGFFGEWVQAEGDAEIISLPDAMDLLVDYYRRVAGEHSDWADYRAAMVRDQRVIVRITLTRAGPDVSG